jgi:hypothetical protein
MKTNITTNLASVVMLAILSPVLAMAILVSIKRAGVIENDVLLVLLTLLSAALSGINGFGRRTTKAPAGDSQAHSVTWSTRQSTNA